MKHQTLLNLYPNLHTIVAVSKTRPFDAIEEKIKDGFTHFGENRVPELMEKAARFPQLNWHFIGNIQTNKLKAIVQAAQWIDSVDSLKQLELIEKYAVQFNKTIHVLIQVNLTGEAQKGGIPPKDLEDLILSAAGFTQIKLKGLMVMGPTDMDSSGTEACFKSAQELFIQTQKNHPEMIELSMGMSHDYDLAYRYGSTMFRLGTILFTTQD